jgi:acid phosphatase (class A)
MALIRKAGVDTGHQSGLAKDFFKRLRPYQIDEGKTCQDPKELAGSYDYPSGHTTWGWTWAMLLSELAPDRATPIMARGRAFGESRIVCGVHNASAVDAGRTTASATLAAVQAQPEFMEDLAKARAELTALRSDPARAKPQGCAAEAALVAQPIL